MRGRHVKNLLDGAYIPFQSTPPCGGDFQSGGSFLPAQDFNPRPHAGATAVEQEKKEQRENFNPRPHAGATNLVIDLVAQNNISIHAPMRGRQVRGPYRYHFFYFNPRPHAGATQCGHW